MVLVNKLLRAAFVACMVVLGGGAPIATVTLVATEAQAAVVSRIEVRGTARMDAETVKTYLTITPGRSFNNQDIDDSVKAIYATGLFTC